MTVEHDAGGKSRFPLRPGVVGAAHFHGENNCRRLWLTRHLEGSAFQAPAVWIGMNPSTAGADTDDPTVIREWLYTTESLGLNRYIKVNVLDYCLTDSKLLPTIAEPCSPENRQNIRDMLQGCRIAIAAWGKLPSTCLSHAFAVKMIARDLGVTLHCLGRNADGSPKHPLYLKKGTPLQVYV